MERIAKFLARAGVCSRRDGEVLIEEGRVFVNGVRVEHPSLKVTEKDDIHVDGKPLKATEETRVWAFYKPVGLVTTHKDPEGRPTVFEHAALKKLPRVISVGRLDLNSEGLLLLTNSGGFATQAEKPSNGWLRTYRVRAFGSIPRHMIDACAKGLTIDGMHYKGVEIELEKSGSQNHWFLVNLKEGKNREIRIIFEYFGMRVNRLIRINYGPYALGNLKPGEITPVPVMAVRS